MKATTYADAQAFLERTRAELESNEAANGLILGISARLAEHPERIKAAPCLKTVEDEGGLVLVALMTPPHNLIVYGHRGDLDGAANVLVEDLIRGGWRVPGVLGPSEMAGRVVERWAEVTGRAYSLGRRQSLYEIREVLTPVPASGRLRLAAEADTELVGQWGYEFTKEIFGEADRQEGQEAAQLQISEGRAYLWEVAEPVSMAITTRPTRRGVSVSGVYTPPAWRRRGYATACVGELTRTLLAAGWDFCTLFADLANATANHVYQRIGYRPICDFHEYTFAQQPAGA